MRPEHAVKDYTTSGPDEWDAYLDPAAQRFGGADVRHTTSSRRPGADTGGTVHRRGRRRLEVCPACSGWTYPLDDAPHAPRHAGGGRQVDCVGREVRPAVVVAKRRRLLIVDVSKEAV